jgi:hypothetical protein
MKTRTQVYKTIKKCSHCHKHTHDVRNCRANALVIEQLHSHSLTRLLQGQPISFDRISLKVLKHLYRRLYPMRRIYMCSRTWIIKELLRHYRFYLRTKHSHVIYHYIRQQKKKKCPVCLSSKVCMETSCNHPICGECYYSYLENTNVGKLSCPLCRSQIQEMKICKRCVYRSFVN